MAALILSTNRLRLTLPTENSASSWRDFVLRNRSHLAPWSPLFTPEMETLDYWQQQVASSQAGFDNGSSIRLLITKQSEPEKVIGSIGFTQIFRGIFCNAILGYQIDQQCEGQGLMREALARSIDYVFNEQKLHRIAANYQPHNVRSGRLLARLGFRIEGFAHDYLFLNGAWRDHILTARINPALTQPR